MICLINWSQFVFSFLDIAKWNHKTVNLQTEANPSHSKRERKSIRQEAKSRNCQQHPNLVRRKVLRCQKDSETLKRKWLHKIQLSVARHRQTCEETWNAESIELAEPLPPLPWLPGLVLSEVRTSITHRTLQGHSERKHRWHQQRQGCQSRLHQGDQAPTLQETSFCPKKMNEMILSQFPILIATLDFGKQINVETFGTIFKMP